MGPNTQGAWQRAQQQHQAQLNQLPLAGSAAAPGPGTPQGNPRAPNATLNQAANTYAVDLAHANQQRVREMEARNRSHQQLARIRAHNAAESAAIPRVTSSALQTHVPTQVASQATSNAAHAAPGWLARNKGKLGLGVGLGLLGYAGLRGSGASAEQDVRIRDYMNNAQRDAATPVPPMAVYAAFDDFAARAKAADFQPVYPTVQGALANSMAQEFAKKFVGEPINAAAKALKKKFYDEPKQQKAFDDAIAGDEMLSSAHAANPQHLTDAFSTLKKFAPSMASHPQATRSFLRQAQMAGTHGSGMDFATIRMLAETEKFIQNSKERSQ